MSSFWILIEKAKLGFLHFYFWASFSNKIWFHFLIKFLCASWRALHQSVLALAAAGTIWAELNNELVKQ